MAKLAAERALALARLPGCETLFTLIDQFNSDTCGTCGFPSAEPQIVRNILRAIQIVLDRTGMPPVMKVENVPQSDGDLVLDHLTDAELAEFSRIMGEYKAFKDAVRAARMQPADGKQIPTSISERIM